MGREKIWRRGRVSVGVNSLGESPEAKLAEFLNERGVLPTEVIVTRVCKQNINDFLSGKGEDSIDFLYYS